APLSEDEERAVREAVDRHMAQRSARYRLRGPELLIAKPPRRGDLPARAIQVLVVDYDNRVNLQIMVAPDGEIIDATPIDWQPSSAPQEVAEARAIAEVDPRVARVAGRTGISVGAFGPHQPEGATGRVIGLRYMATVDGQLRLTHAVVNLSTGELV